MTDRPKGDPAAEDWVPDALRYFIGPDGGATVDAVIATMSFAMGQVNADGPTPSGWSVQALERLGVPVLQAMTVGSSQAQWDASQRGLTPVDTAMNVALPEFDGRIITVPISFKEAVDSRDGVCPPGTDPRPNPSQFEETIQSRNGAGHAGLGAPVVAYVPRKDRVERVVGLALRLAALRRKPNAEKRVALILTNYNAKASRIGNAVGLDTPASVLRLLHALREAGYDVGDSDALPPDGDALLAELVDRCSYDMELLTEAQLGQAVARVTADQYAGWFDSLPDENRRQMANRWGQPPGEAYVQDGHVGLAGLRFGNVFVAIQPPRGYGMDPNLIYHQPDLPPTHHYHALYRWLREASGADAIVHVGKHGTLEWLPGKSVGLSETCYPDQLLGDLPLVYPFIINDPGEGAQAKRRAHAVIVDHLTPPMTTADAYGKLDELTRLVDEYYQVEALDPTKLPMLQQQIWELMVDAKLDGDVTLMIQRLNQQGDHTHEWDPAVTEDGTPTTLAEMRSKDFAHLVENLDAYLCELGSALIRGGLHTLGEAYDGERLRDLVLAMVRVPNLDVPSLRSGVAMAFGLRLDDLVDALGARLPESEGVARLAMRAGRPVTTGEPESRAARPSRPQAKRSATGSARAGTGSEGTGTGLGRADTDSGRTSTGSEGAAAPHRTTGSGRAEVWGSGQSGQDSPTGDERRNHPLATATDALSVIDSPQYADARSFTRLATTTDALEAIDGLCARVVERLQATGWASDPAVHARIVREVLGVDQAPPEVLRTLGFIAQLLIPRLEESAHDEVAQVLSALDGAYVPAGPSGAPTRGMAHVLPTGRNFYAIDPRTMPSRSAWLVGQQLAAELVERHRRETGAYPESVGLSVWGTSAMRTHGDDIAQAFALLGVRPVWQAESQRLDGVEVVPLEELGRPRVDVVCRISGFFRDAFPHVPGILDEAVRRVAELEEPPEQNPLRKRYLADRARLEAAGLDSATASRRATYRVFGSKPGTYGAGILPLIDEGNWHSTADFARAYVNWGGYAYTAEEYGVDARQQFEAVLGRVQVAAKNQDNREHDIFDSDDYLQFHGGMIATIRALSGAAPRRYFGDTSDPARAKVRDLKEEALRVFRTRVVNPKWIERIKQHGYKGALELAATVDYLFGYDATADVLDDWMYEEITRTYVLEPAMQAFFAQSNPWALKDMSARLLEAMDRGLWQQPSDATRRDLQQAYLASEEALEGRAEGASGSRPSAAAGTRR